MTTTAAAALTYLDDRAAELEAAPRRVKESAEAVRRCCITNIMPSRHDLFAIIQFFSFSQDQYGH